MTKQARQMIANITAAGSRVYASKNKITGEWLVVVSTGDADSVARHADIVTALTVANG
jgi:hypothetical protein